MPPSFSEASEEADDCMVCFPETKSGICFDENDSESMDERAVSGVSEPPVPMAMSSFSQFSTTVPRFFLGLEGVLFPESLMILSNNRALDYKFDVCYSSIT